MWGRMVLGKKKKKWKEKLENNRVEYFVLFHFGF